MTDSNMIINDYPQLEVKLYNKNQRIELLNYLLEFKQYYEWFENNKNDGQFLHQGIDRISFQVRKKEFQWPKIWRWFLETLSEIYFSLLLL